ncbi:MAG TPA: efflux RND transporter periplasmic adaptor subunit, partial [Deltaproteobacteria bacterium]|nr:efflux RND transporter periplasmic adaptor subunit [Deltaproteobacteria bacterium]
MEKKDLQRLSLEKPSGGATRPAGRTLLAALAAGAACVAAAALVWYFSTRSTEVKVASVARMYPSQLVSELEASGYVVAQRKADVAAKVTGRITEMLVREGSVVR